MSKIFFSCNIINFDSYQLSPKPQLNNKNKQENNLSKSQINNNCSKKSQIIGNNNKLSKQNFFIENNISLYNPFMNRDIQFFPIIRIFCIFMEHKNALYSANIIKKRQYLAE